MCNARHRFTELSPELHVGQFIPYLTSVTIASVLSQLIISVIIQGCTNPGRQVARTTKVCTVAPNICGFLVWNLLHITLMAPRILSWLLYFFKNMCPPVLRDLFPWRFPISTVFSFLQTLFLYSQNLVRKVVLDFAFIILVLRCVFKHLSLTMM